MSKSLVVGAGVIASLSADTTYYGTITIGGLNISTTESRVQRTYRTAGTFSRLYIRVKTNNRGASSVIFRKNGANGNQTVTIPASTTGSFEDTGNSDIVAIGDEVNFAISVGTGGTTFVVSLFSILLDSLTSAITTTYGSTANPDMTGVSFYQSVGQASSLGTNNEERGQVQTNTAGTIANLFVSISVNQATDRFYYKVRVNGVTPYPAVMIDIPALTTGTYEDLANTATVAANDTLGYKMEI